jgi:hypothetical protein
MLYLRETQFDPVNITSPPDPSSLHFDEVDETISRALEEQPFLSV